METENQSLTILNYVGQVSFNFLLNFHQVTKSVFVFLCCAYVSRYEYKIPMTNVQKPLTITLTSALVINI